MNFKGLPSTYYALCRILAGSPAIDTSGSNQIVNGNGTLDMANMRASVSWTRPLDPSYDGTMTLTPSNTLNIWLTWGNFLADIDENSLSLS